MTSHQNHLQPLSGNKFILIFLLGLLLSACDIFHKGRAIETNTKEPEVISADIPEKEITESEVNDTEENITIESSEKKTKWEKKASYNIAFILPFSIDAGQLYTLMNDDNITTYQPLAAISLYEGALLALDSLKAMHINLEVHVFNAAKDSNNITTLFTDGSLDSMDLIFGPVFNECLIPAARYAKEAETYLISPLSPSLNIASDNPFYVMANASLNTQLRKSAEFLNAKKESVNIIIVHQADNANEIKLASDFEAQLDASQPDSYWRSVSVVQSIASIENMLEPTMLNCIFLATQNELFVNQILRTASLVTKNHNVMLMGLSSVLNFESVSLDYLEALNFHYPNSFWVDPLAPRVRKFKDNFVEKYKAAPDEFAYRGYDLTLYAGYLLWQYGPDIAKGFDKAKPVTHLLSPVQFSPEKKGNDSIQFYENQSITILRYSNFRFEKAN